MGKQLTPAQFVAKWSRVQLSERAASHEHFIDLCRMLGQPTPAEHDATGAEYTFEKGVTPTAGASRGAAGERGFADVWWRGKFGWEYKRKDKYKDLKEAYRQLCQYREALENPPLLIVSDIARIEIHTNFTGTAKRIHVVTLDRFAEPESLELLRRVFTDPMSFRPDVTAELVTRDVAERFGQLARALRSRGHDPHEAAHFLMKCMFCLFAEDVGLLPGNLFTRILDRYRKEPAKLTDRLTELFDKMRTGGDFGADSVAYFNGGLFDEAPALRLTAADIDVLLAAAGSDWASVEPAIFGTLFERSLDPNTRAQIGAHYTSRDDIMLVVEPVVMAPLRREWEAVKADVEAQLDRRRKGKGDTKKKADKAIEKALGDFVNRLATLRILDPACGSGNFLYVAIQQLLHLEKEVITYAARPDIALGLFPQVRPTQLHGIEINPYAAELAQVVIWIGYLQWMRDNGFAAPRDPILEPLQTIECRDAILEFLPNPCRPDSEPRRSRREVARSIPRRNHQTTADDEWRHPTARHEWRGSGTEHRASLGRGGTYLLTWTTYGTWLPGDERGFVGWVPDDKGGHVIHNIPGEPYDADEPRLRAEAERKRKGSALRLTGDQARVCVEAFEEVCEKYGYTIHAGAVMSNHVHLVVSSESDEGPRLLNLFKGVSSRRLGQRFGRQPSGSWWTTGGSRRLIRDARAFDNAVNYVRNQANILAWFEYEPPNHRRTDMHVPSPDIHVPSPDIHVPSPDIHVPSPDIHVGGSGPDMNVGTADSNVHVKGSTPPGVNVGARPPGENTGAPATPPAMNGGARAVPARWPDADFIIGNPPFLGSKLFRQQGLPDPYIDAMYSAFDLPKTSDLCCYWFELARRRIEYNGKVRVGLLATQGIRGADNRTVLERIKQTGDIFMAWSDRNWILDGAAVHVSIVAFDGRTDTTRTLDGAPITEINADLSTADDVARAQPLCENADLYVRSPEKGAKFEIPFETARELLRAPNPNGRPSSDVLRPWVNGQDLVNGRAYYWIIDFHQCADETEAAGYERVFEYVSRTVKPTRESNRDPRMRANWWRFRRSGEGVRNASVRLARLMGTTMVAKHRLFAWLERTIQPDKTIPVFARSDDYFFGVLHSSIHELWARRMGTQLREAESGFRYTPTTCFETFPLPWPPGKEPCPSPGVHAGLTDKGTQPPAMNGGNQPPAINGGARADADGARAGDGDDKADRELYERMSTAAKELNEQRERWLNPPEWVEPIARAVDIEDDFADVPVEARALIRHSAIMARAANDPKLKKRTLTNLYNERPTWLKLAHTKLDQAVLGAYAAVNPEGGWSEDWADVWVDTGAGFPLPDNHPLAAPRKETDQRVLANLLRMNLARASAE